MGNVWNALEKNLAEQEQSRPSGEETPGKPERPPVKPPAGGGQSKYAENLVACHQRGSRVTEQYRSLRTMLLAQNNNSPVCTVITSADKGEGKTVTCLNLAFILAEKKAARVIVIDGDLRRPRIAALLKGKSSPGLADILAGQCTLAEAVQETSVPNLWFVPAGELALDEIGCLYNRESVEELMRELRQQYDHILIDSPPVSTGTDTTVLGQAAGQAIMVVRMHKTPLNLVQRAISNLRGAEVPVAGLILTHQKKRVSKYLNYYSRY